MKEVEIKVPLTADEYLALPHRALAQGFLPGDETVEKDQYYNGIGRDFFKTDEALRLRSSQAVGGGEKQAFLTYKGPKLDGVSMTRKELETGVQLPDTAHRILDALGFCVAMEVEKQRRTYHKDKITLCLDQVKGLGYYLELELMMPEEESHEQALSAMNDILLKLGVPGTARETRSYLELLLRGQKP